MIAIDEIFKRAPVLPVLAISNLAHAVPLASALVEAGLPVLEVTLRTPIALKAIEAIARHVPGAIVGAGTVLRAQDLSALHSAGAVFAISPGATRLLYEGTSGGPIPWIPAISSASEIMLGLEYGHQRFKFFPAAASGGIPALKSFYGPFADVRFCPTGGIDALNAAAYLALPNVLTVGGSWMVPPEALTNADWVTIGTLARAARALNP